MSMLLPTLIGIAFGVWIARRLHLDEIETIADLCFAVVGAWAGGLIAFVLVPYTLGAGTTVLAVLLNVLGAFAGAIAYKVIFHPHKDRHLPIFDKERDF